MNRGILFFALLILTLRAGYAQVLENSVDELEGVGVEERLDTTIPLDTEFRDSAGNSIMLGDLFSGDRPILLSLNYSDCPMLCRLQLNGLVDGLRDMKLSAGKDFDIVSVSIDPLETPQRARQTKQNYVRAYGRPGTAGGWHFLCGNSDSIQRLADAVGFQFKYLPERKEYSHAAVTIVVTPEGKVSRYLYGVVYPPTTLRLALVEAAAGKIGTTLDRVLLFCFHYDATSGKYTPVARRMMQLGAAATIAAIGLTVVPAWVVRRRGIAVSRSEKSLPSQLAASQGSE